MTIHMFRAILRVGLFIQPCFHNATLYIINDLNNVNASVKKGADFFMSMLKRENLITYVFLTRRFVFC